jgi:TPP-dependent pyruvate/acetoin dehydrogenase alpha subunit
LPLLLKDAPLEKLLAGVFERAASSPPSDPLQLAKHAAIANKRSRAGQIAMVIEENKATPLRATLEAMRSASPRRLPMVVVSLRKTIPLKPRSCNFPSITVDGNDAVAVYRVVSEAIAHARKGSGPTLIECASWENSDPIQNMEKYLTRKGLLNKRFTPNEAARFNQEFDAALATVRKTHVLNGIAGLNGARSH